MDIDSRVIPLYMFLIIGLLYMIFGVIKIIVIRIIHGPNQNVPNDNEPLIQNNSRVRLIVLTNNDSNMSISNALDLESQVDEELPQCPICHDILEKNVIKTECSHTFHKECLLSWIGSNQQLHLKCPICVQSLTL